MAESQQARVNSQRWINRVWYGRSVISLLLLPLSGIFWLVITFRKLVYTSIPGLRRKYSVPIIVVGNVSVGGTGKTPMVIFLCEQLKKLGYKPGIASRGYGGGVTACTLLQSSHSANEVGDEPILIFKRTNVPVMVGANRIEVIEKLISDHQCEIVICDDGLQDYRFVHDIEISMVDGDRQFGNKRLLPAGPLREQVSRVSECDLQVVTSRSVPELSTDCMNYQVHDLVAINDPNSRRPIGSLNGKTVHAIAGIANPRRFFDLLRAHGLKLIEHAYDDHAVYSPADFEFPDNYPVLITEKDAVKCINFNANNVWYLPVTAQLPDSFVPRIQQLLRGLNG